MVDDAFRTTNTDSIHFKDYLCSPEAEICEPGWYLKRTGFWHRACWPAACWQEELKDLFVSLRIMTEKTPHTLAHLGALHSSVWAMKANFSLAGEEMDRNEKTIGKQWFARYKYATWWGSTVEISFRRLVRSYGPHPIATDGSTSGAVSRAGPFLRQSHAERDLEVIGRQKTSKATRAM